MANENSTFKKPSVDLKLLNKGRKQEPPVTSGSDSGKTLPPDSSELPPIPYKEPEWSGICDPAVNYSFEVLKNGVIIETVGQLHRKAFWLFGRLPNCDINMAHPTISRYHAILQYRCAPENQEVESDEEPEETRDHVTIESGWYLYDLNSTHGTFLNKQRLKSKTYVRVRVGYMIKLGSSSRTYILQGPTEDEDEPSAMTITEMKEMRQKQEELRQEMVEIERQENERIQKLKEAEGINWGMAEDADEETDLAHNPYAASNNEELFLDDPKKTLRGYFEREGLELDYKLDEPSAGTYVCKVELPVDDDLGRAVIAEATHKGKKKEVVVQCALEACRILDRYGLLRQATHEPRRRFKRTSDSDEDDDFLDRTGDVERRRQRKQTKSAAEVHTYEDLIRQESKILERLEEIEAKIQQRQTIERGIRLPENDDDVDEFLTTLSEPYDKFEVRRLRLEKERLTKDHVTLQKLIKIAKPLDLPSLSQNPTLDAKQQLKKKMMPLFGKRNKLNKAFGIKKSDVKVGGSTSTQGDAEEEEEEEDDCEKVGEKEDPPNKEKKVVPSTEETVKRSQGPVCSTEHLEKTSQTQALPKYATDNKNKIIDSKTDHYSVAGKASEKRRSEGDCEEEPSSSNKKKRNRFRVREKNRDNVDFDDSEELQNEEKNVEWVPPENQTGDGMTSLNEKFGY
ncbi:kanadaptin [Toxorhynchites rutilus septentrionalis]|uniref:kanadaptin n=1 Tax=Toxorhynchites rutilus septentrionalis TaxID=329112 RepID=UPI00247AA3D4|nr:kanadaptin [Toxorhynchites rutilus septentrionalis]